MALVENIQRHDLDPIEIALSYQRLIDEIQLTQEQMSERVGKKRSQLFAPLKLDPIIQTGIRVILSAWAMVVPSSTEDLDIQTDIYQK
jgi:ParB family chromosome partitioning protein